MSGGGSSGGGGEEADREISEVLSSVVQPLPIPLFYSRTRRSSQHVNAREKMLHPGSDHDLKLKSISCKPTTEVFEVEEEMEGQQEEDEEEQEEEEEEEKEEEEEEEEEEEDEEEEEEGGEEDEEDSMEVEKKEFAEHQRCWENRFGKGFGASSE
jgi:TATA-binding protein-associated factor Taf7